MPRAFARRSGIWLGRLAAGWFVCVAAVCAPVHAALVSLVSQADTSLMEGFPTNNLGAEGYVTCGSIQNRNCGTLEIPQACRNRALFRFDVAGAVPRGARIRSASLTVWVSNASQDEEANVSSYTLHRMLVPWTQGGGTNRPMFFPGALGRPVQPGEPCWAYRRYPDVPWGSPGGAPGVDYDPAIHASLGYVDNRINETYTFVPAGTQLVADLQSWLDHPESNHGWLMRAGDESIIWTAKRFITPESGLYNYPLLEIDFVPPPRLEPTGIVSNALRFNFTAEAGQAYEVQAASLVNGVWRRLLNVPAAEEATNVVILDPLSPARSNRFYRVIAP